MKKSWVTLSIAAAITLLHTVSAFATVYYPNSNIPAEEITTEATAENPGGVTNSGDGWKQDENGWRWQYSNGAFALNQWMDINREWFYFNQDGYMVTGWQNIHSDSYSKAFDYFFASNGALAFSPSERFAVYGHSTNHFDTVARAQAQGAYLQKIGVNGQIILNQPASDVLNGDGSIANPTTYLNSGLFICNGNGGPGAVLFSADTALTGGAAGGDQSGNDCTSVKGHTMNNCKIALYFGGESGAVGSEANRNKEKGDLLAYSRAEGALGAFGFWKPVFNQSVDKFGPELVRGLTEGKTLTDAAQDAAAVVPVYDACRINRVVGGDTRFHIALAGYAIPEIYEIPSDETYTLYYSYLGYETYVQTVNDIMTSDYYTVSPDGTVIGLRDKISESSIPKKRSRVAVHRIDNNSFKELDVYEKVHGKIELVRIKRTTIDNGDYNHLKIKVENLETGKEIPYKDILDSY